MRVGDARPHDEPPSGVADKVCEVARFALRRSLAYVLQRPWPMGAIENFLKRWGFARLERYGLVLTPEDRILATRPAILDDGLGGKIVGWLEGDLAAMELEHWGPPKPKKKKLIAAPASLHKLPPAPPPVARTVEPVAAPPAPAAAPAPVAAHAPVAAPAPIAAPSPIAAAPAASVSAATAIPAPSPAPAPEVAASDDAGEDEWEWEIAMARARAAAEEAEQARVELLGASAVIAPPVIPRKTNPGMAVVAPGPARSKLEHEPEPLPPWPGTEPYNETWADTSEVAPHVMSVLRKKLAADKRTPAKATATVAQPQKPIAPVAPRATVIPVPQLPTVADPRSVRPVSHTPSQPRGRIARGTGTSGRLEETVRTHAVPPANDDRTSPYVTLPSEVKPSGYAHTKRVAAKQR